MVTEPPFWMNEISGVLRPAIAAYLYGGQMTQQQIEKMRAYLRQWIDASVWDENVADAGEREWLATMRFRIDELTSREALNRWLVDALEGGMDPLLREAETKSPARRRGLIRRSICCG